MLPVEAILMAKHLLCLLGRHRWQRLETTEAGAGQDCARCGEVMWLERPSESHGPRDRDWKSHVNPG